MRGCGPGDGTVYAYNSWTYYSLRGLGAAAPPRPPAYSASPMCRPVMPHVNVINIRVYKHRHACSCKQVRWHYTSLTKVSDPDARHSSHGDNHTTMIVTQNNTRYTVDASEWQHELTGAGSKQTSVNKHMQSPLFFRLSRRPLARIPVDRGLEFGAVWNWTFDHPLQIRKCVTERCDA